MQEREALYDKMKGIGMLLLFWGHLFTYGSVPFSLIFAFHMPLFFFISGLLLHPTDRYVDYIKKCIRKYIVPYIFFWCVGFLIMIVKWAIGLDSLDWQGYLKATLHNLAPNQGYVGAIWFLPVLAVSLVLTNFIVNTSIHKSEIGKVGIVLALAVTSIFMQKLPIHIMQVTTLFTTTLFVYIGYLMQGSFIGLVRNKYSIIGMMVALPIFLVLAMFNKTVNIAVPCYNDYVLYMVCELLGIYITAVLADFSACKPFTFFGKNSLVIFSTHGMSLAAYAYLLEVLLGRPIHYMENIPDVWCVVGGIVVMLLSIPLYYIFNPILLKITQKR